MTKGMKQADGGMLNPSAGQLQLSYFARLHQLKYPSVMFLEQHRMVKGLSEPPSSIWYGGRIIDALGTEMSRRPLAQKCDKFIYNVWQIKVTVPRLVFNLPTGVCITDPRRSRKNLHNIAVTLKLIGRLVQADVFTVNQIVIQTPYWGQGLSCRSALHNASKMRGWRDYHIVDMQVITVDSSKGGKGLVLYSESVPFLTTTSS